MSGSIGKIVGTVAGFAIGGPAGAQMGASLGGAYDASKAQGKATGYQVGALGRATATMQEAGGQSIEEMRSALKNQKGMLDKALEMGQPYRVAGESAQEQYSRLLSGTGEEQLAALQATPGYQFQMEQGTQALERGAAARSGLLSGRQTKALTRFGQGLAGTTYNTFMDRLQQQAAQGQQAALMGGEQLRMGGAQQAATQGALSNRIYGAGTDIANLQMGTGAVQAAGVLGQQQAQATGMSDIFKTAGSLGGGSGGKFGGGYGDYGSAGRIDWY